MNDKIGTGCINVKPANDPWIKPDQCRYQFFYGIMIEILYFYQYRTSLIYSCRILLLEP